MFQNTNQNLGRVKQGTKLVVKYPFTDIAIIDEVKTSCSCSIEDIDRVNNVLKVKFSAGEVPPHLFGQGYYTSCITTTVKYKTTDEPTVPKEIILIFTVTVER